MQIVFYLSSLQSEAGWLAIYMHAELAFVSGQDCANTPQSTCPTIPGFTLKKKVYSLFGDINSAPYAGETPVQLAARCGLGCKAFTTSGGYPCMPFLPGMQLLDMRPHRGLLLPLHTMQQFLRTPVIANAAACKRASMIHRSFSFMQDG